MDINGARVLVAGATGALGAALTAELVRQGARPAIAGRDRSRLSRITGAHPGVPTVLFDAYDPASCARAVRVAAGELGGLDAVVTAFGTVAFGTADEVGDEVAEHLMAVNFLAPAAFFRAALDVLTEGSVIAALTGVVAERPQPGMADYSASKAALGAWVAGTAPPMPPGGDPDRLVGALVTAPATDGERLRTAPDGEPVVERRAR
ncbi:SDR family NAD(P)-dependent oxidoreductase [Streptomyces sp. NPDC052415]|uniref:SDR family NAD(P)-dependent oxidoreductase n=1 Tax=Streptomyces sp. NPDC052415 TaxID=3365690 RepID=UPI0037D5A46B